MKIPVFLSVVGAIGVLSGCMEIQITGIRDMSASDIEPIQPPDAEPGACYGKEISPAVVETVTRQIKTRDASYADDGTLLTPASYRTETFQKIVTERADIWFKVPCQEDKVDAYVASLQRALSVRGYYRGKITGELDLRTRKAIRRYQKPRGLDSNKLSLDSARSLGLAAVERPKDDSSG